MPIRLKCGCGKTLSARDELAGKNVRCPGCRAVLKVPLPNLDDLLPDVPSDPLRETDSRLGAYAPPPGPPFRPAARAAARAPARIPAGGRLLKKPVLIGLLVVGGIFAVRILGGWVARRGAAVFEGELRRLENVSFPPSPEGVRDGELPWAGGSIPGSGIQLPCRRGKVFVVKRGRVFQGMSSHRVEAEVDPAWYDLNSSLRAASPGEIGTLVVTNYTYQAGPHYQMVIDGKPTGGAALQLGTAVVNLQIFDMERKVLLGTWTIEGPPPPASFDPLKDAYTSGSQDEVRPALLEFLKQMPTR